MPTTIVEGRKVYFESHGEHGGVPLVLVMGLGGSCTGWSALQVPEFSQHHRTVIYENRGIGSSEDPGGAFTTADLADDLAGLLDALEIDRAHVLGAFLGGMTAQELALRHPGRVERLILVGTYTRPDAKRRMLLEKWRAMAEIETPGPIFSQERLLWTLSDETLEQTDLIEAMSASFPGAAPAIAPDLLARQCDACLNHDSADRVRKIHHPTLVLCGRYDQLTPTKMARELADEIPQARLVTFSQGAHLVVAEAAERFNETVLGFLAE